MKADFLGFLKAGTIEFHPFYAADGKQKRPVKTQTSDGTGTLGIHCAYSSGVREDFYFTFTGTDGVLCRRVFTNGSSDLKLEELGFTLSGLDFGGKKADDYFYHNENPRIYERMTFPVDYSRTSGDAKDSNFDSTAGNRWADPGVVCDRVGRSPYQPFPAIHLGNYAKKHGIVHGTLSQKVFYHNYLVSHAGGKVVLDVFSSFKDLDFLALPAGGSLVDEWYLGSTDRADDIEHIFDGYTAELRKKLPANYGATSINRDNMVWGSWNDGIFRDVSESMILREAAYLKAHFPTVRWIQLDDGYAADVPPAHGLGVPYEGEAGVDHKKFPKGLRHFTDGVRACGLRPAIWIGGLCAHKTRIYREHPDWFCDYSLRLADQSPLDVSQPVARAYMEHALDVLITESGFEGVKHDFWSYAFEDSHALYRNKDRSGYFYRDWWTKEIRRRIASDGYFQTGCDIVMGNPFLGEHFTNYRYGIDIGGGAWDNVRTNFQWGIACFATHTGDLFVPNSDSVGLFPGLNDTDAMFALNYCVATHSMVEIAGKLSENPDHPRLKHLKKAVCCVNNGQDVYLIGYDYRKPGRHVPYALYFRTPQFSTVEGNPLLPLRTVGLFNSDDAKKTVSFSASSIDLDSAKDYRVIDVWTHEEFVLKAGRKLSFPLIPHGSMLLAVAESGLSLLDANAKVNSVEKNGKTLILDLAFAVPEAEFLFSDKVKSVKFGGKTVKVKRDGRSCSFDAAKPGKYEFSF